MTEPEVQELAARFRAEQATVYVVDVASSRDRAGLQHAIGAVVPLAPALTHVHWDALADSLSGAVLERASPGDTVLVLGPLNTLEDAEHESVLGLLGVLEHVEATCSEQGKPFRACLWWRAPAKTAGYCSDRRLSAATNRVCQQLVGRRLIQFCVDKFGLNLNFDEQWQLRAEGPVEISEPHRAPLAASALLECTVVKVELTSSQLTLSFDTGAVLTVALGGRFESFTVTGPANELGVG